MLASRCGRPIYPVSADVSKVSHRPRVWTPVLPWSQRENFSLLSWGATHLGLTHFFPLVINTSFCRKKPNFMNKGCTAQRLPPLKEHLWCSHTVIYEPEATLPRPPHLDGIRGQVQGEVHAMWVDMFQVPSWPVQQKYDFSSLPFPSVGWEERTENAAVGEVLRSKEIGSLNHLGKESQSSYQNTCMGQVEK